MTTAITAGPLAGTTRTSTWSTNEARGCFQVEAIWFDASGAEVHRETFDYLEDHPPVIETPAESPATPNDVTVAITGVEGTGTAANLGG